MVWFYGDIITIAALAECFAKMYSCNIDYKEVVESLGLKAKKEKGSGFGNQKAKKEVASKVNQTT